MLGLFSLFVLYKSFEEEINKYDLNQTFIFIISSLWFFPFLHARPSNENLCASFFIFGLYFIKKSKTHLRFFLSGTLLGISFIIRFQMIAMIAPGILWFIVFERDFKKHINLILGFLFTLTLSTAFDTYMYGHFTFAPYNYFFLNIIKNYASTFGTTPSYQYFIYCLRECTPVLGAMVISSYFYFWIKFPKHLLTWITLPFFIIHSFIGHKEFRFLFPMAPMLPLIIIFVLHSLKWKNKRIVINLFLVFNIPLLIYFSFTPAMSTQRYFKYLYERATPVDKVYVFSKYEDNVKFYLKNDIEYVVINNSDISKSIQQNTSSYFLTKNIDEQDLVLMNKQCKIVFSLYPTWLYQIDFIKKRRTFRNWSFIECNKAI
jgi:phosphatidylinositol glycan class B